MTDIFVPKPFVDIVAGMIERVRASTDRLTDFNVGSAVRSILEAGSVELDDYYQEVYSSLLRAIPTAIYIGFGFDLRDSVAASGVVRFTRVGDTDTTVAIPAGTRLVSAAGVYYLTDAEAVLIPGSESVETTATCEQTGTAGNANPGAIGLVPGVLVGTAISATNPAIFSGGLDGETEEERATRFAQYILSLARGTAAALEYAATLPALYHPTTGVLAERVQRAAIAETPGHVDLFVHNGSYGASDALISAVQTLIDGYRDPGTDAWVGGYRPAGMQVVVQPMVDESLNVSIELSGLTGAARTAAETALSASLARWLRARLPGERVRPIDLVNVALALDGVAEATILAPTATLTVAPNTVLFLGTLTLTWV